jgi:hypothetical protein
VSAAAGRAAVVAAADGGGDEKSKRNLERSEVEMGSMMRKPLSIVVCAFMLGLSAPAAAQEAYETPDAAVDALAGAAKSDDMDAILKILGPEGEDIVSSGDEVADKNTREAFVAAYDKKHAIEKEGDGTYSLVLGDDDWPFPIPIAWRDGGWRFDSATGVDEILRRRIGRNELSAIEVNRAYVEAQNEYAALDPAKLGRRAYAQRIVSRPGKKDGLYWPTEDGEAASPLGALAAEAEAEGYKAGQTPIPYHGYYYRVLTRQGAAAPGGAYDYIDNGKMVGGFALVAYPAEYGNSGIMTFMVSHDGQVFQQDLGPNTARLARDITAFDPGPGWTKAE